MGYKKKVEEEDKFIIDFRGYSRIITLNKQSAGRSVLFCTIDIPDRWLIDIVEYRENTGLIIDTYMITNKDLDKFIELYKEIEYIEMEVEKYV